jgi:hypothetical protein
LLLKSIIGKFNFGAGGIFFLKIRVLDLEIGGCTGRGKFFYITTV